MEATIIHGGQCHGSFCTFLFRGIFSGLIELTNSTASLSDSHSCRFTLRSIRWGF